MKISTQSKIFKKTILQAVATQIKTGNPKATKETYERLIAKGETSENAKQQIAKALIEETHEMLNKQETFNEKRFTEKLSKL